jgi:hypothetical protein
VEAPVSIDTGGLKITLRDCPCTNLMTSSTCYTHGANLVLTLVTHFSGSSPAGGGGDDSNATKKRRRGLEFNSGREGKQTARQWRLGSAAYHSPSMSLSGLSVC